MQRARQSTRALLPQAPWRASLLYLAHVLLELVLGGVKLRGTYKSVVVPDEAAKFVQHHGVSLLALTLLGALVLLKGLVSTPAGQVASLTLAFFHAGAVAVMVNASHWSVVIVHVPFAIGFALHAMTGNFR